MCRADNCHWHQVKAPKDRHSYRTQNCHYWDTRDTCKQDNWYKIYYLYKWSHLKNSCKLDKFIYRCRSLEALSEMAQHMPNTKQNLRLMNMRNSQGWNSGMTIVVYLLMRSLLNSPLSLIVYCTLLGLYMSRLSS